MGRKAVAALADFKRERALGNEVAAGEALALFEQNKAFLGYGHLAQPEDAVPPLALSFYSFHFMVLLSGLLMLICIVYLVLALKNRLDRYRWVLRLGLFSYLAAMIAHMLGWIVAEVGRQPWAIQDLLPVSVARSNLTTGTVQTTFFLFLVLFTVLLIAEIRIMTRQIAIGPEEDGHDR